jgi:hypothetical protein
MLQDRTAARPAPGRQERPTVVRASTARPLPALRAVPDFVALQDGSRSVSGETAFLFATAAAFATGFAASLLGVATGASVAGLVTWPYAVVLAVAAVGLPAGRAVFRALALALDHPTPVQQVRPRTPVTVVVNGASDATIASLRAQDYGGATGVVTADAATIRPVTPLTLVVDAGVVLHPSALRLLVARLASSPDTVAVAAHSLVLATNSGVTAEASAAAWTHDLDAAQRCETLFAGPLGADSACTLIRTDSLGAVPGWAMPGSRAAMTWRLLERGARVTHEPLAIVFVPEHATLTTTARGRAARVRAARAAAAGNALSALPQASSRWVARLDVWAPVLDGIVALAWAQAVALAVLGHVSLLVLVLVLAAPLALVPVVVERRRHAATLEEAGLMLVAPAVWVSYLGAFDGLRAVLSIATLRDAPPRRSAPAPVPLTRPAPVQAPRSEPPPLSWPPSTPPAPTLWPAAPPAHARPHDALPIRRVRRLGRRARPYA